MSDISSSDSWPRARPAEFTAWLIALTMLGGSRFWRWRNLRDDVRDGIAMRVCGRVEVITRRSPRSGHPSHFLELADDRGRSIPRDLYERLAPLAATETDAERRAQVRTPRNNRTGDRFRIQQLTATYSPRAGIVLEVIGPGGQTIYEHSR